MPLCNAFLFTVKPTLTHEHYAKVSGGTATVFVVDDNPELALERAKNRVRSANWEITEIEIYPPCAEFAPSQYPELTQIILAAKTHGIGCYYTIGRRGGSIFN